MDERAVKLSDGGRTLRLYAGDGMVATLRSESMGVVLRAARMWLAHVPLNDWLTPVVLESIEVGEPLAV